MTCDCDRLEYFGRLFFIYVNFVEYIGINISHRYLYLGILITSKLRAALPIPIPIILTNEWSLSRGEQCVMICKLNHCTVAKLLKDFNKYETTVL